MEKKAKVLEVANNTGLTEAQKLVIFGMHVAAEGLGHKCLILSDDNDVTVHLVPKNTSIENTYKIIVYKITPSGQCIMDR